MESPRKSDCFTASPSGVARPAKYLLEAAKKANADTRWLAIRGLGMVKFQEATPFLLESLGSPEHYVRAHSALGLG